jgi:hypothetical protein
VNWTMLIIGAVIGAGLAFFRRGGTVNKGAGG